MGQRRETHTEPGGLWHRIWELGQAHQSAILIATLLIVMGTGTYVLWCRFAPHIFAQRRFQLTEESVEVTAQPPWIVHSNVCRESVQAGSLTDLHIREVDLTLRVAQAFRMHPWVREVKYVSKKFPAGVTVELVYRKPVAMVEVVVQEQPGRLPIDADGVLLPTVDFSQEAADQYPRISAKEAPAVSNMAGDAWGDERIHGAARLADQLLSSWAELQFHKIVAHRGARDEVTPTSSQSEPYFVLHTKKGTHVLWGRAPGKERTGEPKAEQKLRRLKEFAAQNGSLDVLAPQQSIDLRRGEQLDIAELSTRELMR